MIPSTTAFNGPPMRFPVWLAVIYGVLLPAAETWRRWDQVVSGTVWWPGLMDDWALGVLLLTALWMRRRDRLLGRRCLIGAWGFVCGMGYGSFFGNLRSAGQADPSGVPHELVAATIGAGWALAWVALIASVLGREQEPQRGGAPSEGPQGSRHQRHILTPA